MVSNTKPEAVQKAIKYCALLLKSRPRSEKELTDKLKKKSFNDIDIAQTLDFLKKNTLINDQLLAQDWIESQIKKHFGIKKIVLKLKSKGIDEQIIKNQIQKIETGYSEEKAVVIIAKEQLNKLKNLDSEKAKSRVYGYLLRRGFSQEIITDVLEKLIPE
ncbi:MAG: regulatory protein RecX [Candidatus Omnitrophota bacterium]